MIEQVIAAALDYAMRWFVDPLHFVCFVGLLAAAMMLYFGRTR